MTTTAELAAIRARVTDHGTDDERALLALYDQAASGPVIDRFRLDTKLELAAFEVREHIAGAMDPERAQGYLAGIERALHIVRGGS